MTRLFLFLTLASGIFADAPPAPEPINFITSKPACSLLNGKLILAKAWPFGSWEDCAYSILNVAGQINQQKAELERKLQTVPTAPTKK